MRTRRVALTMALALLWAAPVAQAHLEQRRIGGHEVAVDVHGHAPTPQLQREMAAAPAPEAMPRRLTRALGLTPSQTFCGDERFNDDTDHQLSDLPRFKVIYAYPADGQDNFATYANLIARSAVAVSTNYANAMGRGLRFDYGTACGANNLDIQVLHLPRTRAQYLSGTDFGRFDLLGTDVYNNWDATQHRPGYVNFVVFADQLWQASGPDNRPWTWGTGLVIHDDTANGIYQQQGGAGAVIWGGGSPNFIGNDSSESYERWALMHEMGHTLGAVQASAPHSTGADHCYDLYDIMCYDDGGPQFKPGIAPCPGSDQSPLSAIDCGNDDYASADPAPGTYLATHWNIYRSGFTCDVCLQRSAQPTAALAVLGSPDHRVGEPVTFDATASADPGGHISTYAFDFDANGSVDAIGANPQATTSFSTPGARTARVTVTDDEGLTATSTVAYAIRSHSPSALIAAPATAVAGTSVTLDASASSDPDGDPLHFAWDLDGDGVYETDTGGVASLDWKPSGSAGARMVGVRVSDPSGEAAAANRTVLVSVPGVQPQSTSARIGTLRFESTTARWSDGRLRLAHVTCASAKCSRRLSFYAPDGRQIGVAGVALKRGASVTVSLKVSSSRIRSLRGRRLVVRVDGVVKTHVRVR